MSIFKFLLLLILFPSIAGANEKYLDPDYTEGQQQIIKWPEKTGDLKKIETIGNQTQKPYSMMWSTDVVRTGDYSLRLEYRDNDCGQDDCPRGDFKGQFGRTEALWISKTRSESWSRFSVFIPKDTMHLPEGYTMFTQWKTTQKDAKGVPCPTIPLLFRLSREGIEVAQEPGDKDCTQTNDLMIPNDEDFKGKWLDFVVHAKWSKKDNGFIHVWVNGNKRHEYHGVTFVKRSNIKLPNLRHNIYTGYKLKGHKQTQVIYFDAFYAGKNCKDLKLTNIGYSCDALGKETVRAEKNIDFEKYKSDGFFNEGKYKLKWTYIYNQTDGNEKKIIKDVIGVDIATFNNGKLEFLLLDNKIFDIQKENREKIVLNTTDGYLKVDADLDFSSKGVTTKMFMIGTLEKNKSGNYYVEGAYNSNERIGITFVPIK